MKRNLVQMKNLMKAVLKKLIAKKNKLLVLSLDIEVKI